MRATAYIPEDDAARPALEVDCECAAALAMLATRGSHRILVRRPARSAGGCRCCARPAALDYNRCCAMCRLRGVAGRAASTDWRAQSVARAPVRRSA